MAFPTDAAAKVNPPKFRAAAEFPLVVLSAFPIYCLLLFDGSTVSVRRLSKSNAAALEGYYFYYYPAFGYEEL